MSSNPIVITERFDIRTKSWGALLHCASPVAVERAMDLIGREVHCAGRVFIIQRIDVDMASPIKVGVPITMRLQSVKLVGDAR